MNDGRRTITTVGIDPGAWNFPKVKGQCSGCSNESLFLAVGGYVTCSYIPCPNPTAASDLLATMDSDRAEELAQTIRREWKPSSDFRGSRQRGETALNELVRMVKTQAALPDDQDQLRLPKAWE